VETLAEALHTAREHMANEDATISLRAANAVAQVAAAFIKAYEAAELQARIEALERAAVSQEQQQIPYGPTTGN
jgi:hypothetical protein